MTRFKEKMQELRCDLTKMRAELEEHYNKACEIYEKNPETDTLELSYLDCAIAEVDEALLWLQALIEVSDVLPRDRGLFSPSWLKSPKKRSLSEARERAHHYIEGAMRALNEARIEERAQRV